MLYLREQLKMGRTCKGRGLNLTAKFVNSHDSDTTSDGVTRWVILRPAKFRLSKFSTNICKGVKLGKIPQLGRCLTRVAKFSQGC